MAWTPTNLSLTCEIDDITGASGLYECLSAKQSGETFYNLNVFSGLSGTIAPDGYDRYILGFWSEVFDETLFWSLYHRNPQAEFVVLSDLEMNDLDKLDRCKWIMIYHWKWFARSVDGNCPGPRRYKVSSLSNRVNEYKFFVTAKLLDHPDAYVTWNARYLEGQNYDYIFQPTGWSHRDSLLHAVGRLKKPINQEFWTYDPEVLLTKSTSHPAYRDSLVNLVNETKDISWDENIGMLPGPYITEKTWKPLLAGNALLFVGQCNIRKTLENVGFKFDYPWIDNYSSCWGDLERLDKLLDVLDMILRMPAAEIEEGIRESIWHNQDLIRSGHIHRWVDHRNEQALERLAKIL